MTKQEFIDKWGGSLSNRVDPKQCIQLRLDDLDSVIQSAIAEHEAGKHHAQFDGECELQELMDEIHKWSNKQFGDGMGIPEKSRSKPIAYHLKKEVNELIEALDKSERDAFDYPLALWEYADVFMLILDSATQYGLRAETLMKITLQKLELNKKRKWSNPDENGVVEHIK